MIEAGRSWRKGVRTHISLDIPNPSGPLFQVSFMFIITAFLRFLQFVALTCTGVVLTTHIDSKP